jgi:hypothetical protein
VSLGERPTLTSDAQGIVKSRRSTEHRMLGSSNHCPRLSLNLSLPSLHPMQPGALPWQRSRRRTAFRTLPSPLRHPKALYNASAPGHLHHEHARAQLLSHRAAPECLLRKESAGEAPIKRGQAGRMMERFQTEVLSEAMMAWTATTRVSRSKEARAQFSIAESETALCYRRVKLEQAGLRGEKRCRAWKRTDQTVSVLLNLPHRSAREVSAVIQSTLPPFWNLPRLSHQCQVVHLLGDLRPTLGPVPRPTLYGPKSQDTLKLNSRPSLPGPAEMLV